MEKETYWVVIIEAEEQRVWGVYPSEKEAIYASIDAAEIYKTRIERV